MFLHFVKLAFLLLSFLIITAHAVAQGRVEYSGEDEVKIGDYKFEAEIAWALIEEIVPLLGRKDIFDKFHVNFKQDRRIIEFVPVG